MSKSYHFHKKVTTKYQALFSVVRAVRLSMDNYKDILNLLLREAIRNDFALVSYNLDNNATNATFSFRYLGELNVNVLKVGDFLVKRNNKLEVWSAEEFLANYGAVEVPPLEVEPDEPTPQVILSDIDMSKFTPTSTNIPTFITVYSIDEEGFRNAGSVTLTITGPAWFVLSVMKDGVVNKSKTITFKTHLEKDIKVNILIENLTSVIDIKSTFTPLEDEDLEPVDPTPDPDPDPDPEPGDGGDDGDNGDDGDDNIDNINVIVGGDGGDGDDTP